MKEQLRPRVSVIIPVYNSQNDLRQCVDSVLCQTYTDFEVILIDDGSTDSSSIICDEYAKMDSRVIVIHKENAGVSAARNDGIARSNGEYITFIDSDDYVDEGYLMLLVEAIEPENVDFAACGHVREDLGNSSEVRIGLVNSKRKVYSVKELLENRDIEYHGCVIDAMCAKIFRREIISKYAIRFRQDMSYGEDTLFVLEYIKKIEKGNCIVLSDDALYHYKRINGVSLSRKYNPDRYTNRIALISSMIDICIQNDCSNSTIDRLTAEGAVLLINTIRHEIRHSGQTARQHSYNLIRKVAGHEVISKVDIQQLKAKQDKIIAWMLKYRLIYVIYWGFYAKYLLEAIAKRS